MLNRKQPSPLSVVEASDHHGVPQRIHLAAPVVHDSGEPGVNRLGTVAVTVTQQLLINTERPITTQTEYLNTDM